MTKDKEILELADVFGVGCRIQCQECPVTARFKTERPEDDELYGPGPCLIIEDGKYVDCVDYIRATAVYDAGYRKQSEVEQKIKRILEKYTTLNHLKTFRNTVDTLCAHGVAKGCYQDYTVLADVVEILGICESIVEDQSEKGGK